MGLIKTGLGPGVARGPPVEQRRSELLASSLNNNEQII
jgi:hypothetical protein